MYTTCRPDNETETEKEARCEMAGAKGRAEKRKFIVMTHLGDYETWATSADKAINNVKFRIYGPVANDGRTKYWETRIVA